MRDSSGGHRGREKRMDLRVVLQVKRTELGEGFDLGR